MGLRESIRKSIQDLISKVPESTVEIGPDRRAQILELRRQASWKAAAVSGALALPGGPFFLITLIPDLALVWRIQAQLVADIARVHGKSDRVSAEVILYCLFEQGDLGLGDIVIRVGERYLVRRNSQRFAQKIGEKLGTRFLRKILGKRAAAILPILGAAAIARYARKDTLQVGEIADEIFSREIVEEKGNA